MENNYESRFDSAARAVCDRLRNYLFLLPTDMKEQAQEIRFRVNQPVSICCTGGVYFLNRNGRPSCRPEPDGMRATREDIDETFRGICSYSVYSHQNEIKNGFITLSGGHRVGLCGTAVISNGSIGSLRDISSINIRIARQVYGCASAATWPGSCPPACAEMCERWRWWMNAGNWRGRIAGCRKTIWGLAVMYWTVIQRGKGFFKPSGHFPRSLSSVTSWEVWPMWKPPPRA